PAGRHGGCHRAHAAPAQGCQGADAGRADPGARERPAAGGAGAPRERSRGRAGRGCRRVRSRRARGGGQSGRRRIVSGYLTLGLAHYLTLGAVLFAIGVVGIFLNRRNLIVILMSIELMLLAVNMNFVAFSHFLGDAAGQIFVFFILTVAAAEAAIGLAILVTLFRNLDTVNVEDLASLKG